MRALWTIVRFVLVLAALGALLVITFFVVTPSGTSIDPTGAMIDAVAVIVLLATLWSLWRDRASLF